ncbi:Sjogren's syndrome/scleroderma autoantigen 1 family, implicated in mitotic cell cycle process [Schizosaccharomyces osmophilus]|uniref:Sjogren's syndrome/scleroderma autoantigen 1 family, implicated in mitotic cell cycle process n=1 Tax=Schizosaccharomyces osmophilus TaxID=2545709 RepID=A0AAF0ATW0_9SCHI|nr:Sjogren's syndrome/scleroderma autoantigen 1 family, implicated in mitotic cell cycle process [Schizosaccharomyces osmophilus]WBW70803.1 Sjogren's syndrome/scleroderma autoantigen 1 family, implicated in mitotic cell cycle process [Schizosaccharomyces osmophilus]
MTLVNDDVSKKLGNYMLRGYTLLDTVCPECQKVPMMRLRDQPMFCVACVDKPKAEAPALQSSQSSSLLENTPHGRDVVQQHVSSTSSPQTTKSEPNQLQKNESSQPNKASVYVKLIDELEAQLEDFIPIPHNESREVAFQRIERILQLIELAKDMRGKI